MGILQFNPDPDPQFQFLCEHGARIYVYAFCICPPYETQGIVKEYTPEIVINPNSKGNATKKVEKE